MNAMVKDLEITVTYTPLVQTLTEGLRVNATMDGVVMVSVVQVTK